MSAAYPAAFSTFTPLPRNTQLLKSSVSVPGIAAMRTAIGEIGEENVFKVGIFKTDNAISSAYVECDTWYKLGLDLNTVYMATESISVNQSGVVF